jgi:predicted permease
MLLKNRGLTIIVVLILGLGLGANIAVFTIVKAILLDPLPGVVDPTQLIVLTSISKTGRLSAISYPDYIDYRDQNVVFTSLAGSATIPFDLTVDKEEQKERVYGELVSGKYFELLGVRAALGRTLNDGDDQKPGAHPVCVISHGFWQRRFLADPHIIGKTLELNGVPLTVVGVAAERFTGSAIGLSLEIFVPLMMQDQVSFTGSFISRGKQWITVRGRLKPGVTLPQARERMKIFAAQLAQQYPKTNERRSIELYTLVTLPNGPQARILPALIIFCTSAVFILLIACANVASLILARTAARRREIAIRMSLGASRPRIIRQLMIECALFCLFAGFAGLLLSSWLTSLIGKMRLSNGLVVTFDFSLNALVLAFALLISILAGAIVGLAPAIQASRPDLVPLLKDESVAPTGGQGKSRIFNTLVVAQVALALMLVIGAGLMALGLQRAEKFDLGFNPNNVLIATLGVAGPKQIRPIVGLTFYLDVLERVRALPGVASACLTALPPLDSMQYERRAAEIEGYTQQRGEEIYIHGNIVSTGYFSTMRIPLLRGRDFTAQDDGNAQDVIIINETMARRFWPDQDPIGKRLRVGAVWRIVIGVTKDSKYQFSNESGQPYMFFALKQIYDPEMTLIIRTVGDPMGVVGSVRGEVQKLGLNASILYTNTLTEYMNNRMRWGRGTALLIGFMGLLALLMASAGIYGLTAYTVSRRTQEIGVRMALGAQPSEILKLVMKRGLFIALTGLGVGLIGAFALSRTMSSLILKVNAFDLSIYVGASLLLGVTSLLANYIPARKAMKVDPMIALRYGSE